MDSLLPATPATPARSGRCDGDRTGAAAPALAARHLSRMGAQSRPSPANSRPVAARCSSPSRIRPRRANACRSASWTRRSNGASSSHFSRYANTSSPAAVAARRSSRTAWQLRKRRRCAVSQALKPGLRSSSRPSRNSPLNSVDSARSRSGGSVSRPASPTRAISIASTKQPARSSLMVSALLVSTRRRPGSSTMLLTLLRHQRSSPRGSFGTSHSSSQSCRRDTARTASAR